MTRKAILHVAYDLKFPTMYQPSSSYSVVVFVKDLGDVLHLIGGTVAALLIFFIPGSMLINAAIVKHSMGELDLLQAEGKVNVRVITAMSLFY